jgi:hypothetical protein
MAFIALVAAGHTASLDVASLPSLQQQGFKVTPYVQAAAALQDMGRDAACQALSRAAETNEANQQIIILCRMLFTARGTNEFRRPGIGMPQCIGGSDYLDWSLEPIELVDGIPFAIAQGYSGGGRPESAQDYLHYCIANCAWSPVHFRDPTGKEKRDALAKLVASGKWKRPLYASEREFLSAQIE